VGTDIHPTAIVDSDARLGENVSIGPYAIVEENVSIGDETTIGSHARIASGTRMGRKCTVFNGASIGTIPQDLKFDGEETLAIIGDNTTFREFCTVNRGTAASGKTVVGSNCTLLAYCHVAHDCIVGDGVVASNNLAMAGHVQVGDSVVFGATVMVHQFVKIGDHSFIQMGSRILRDVVPFAMCGGDGSDPSIMGINTVGLERRGFDGPRRAKIKKALRLLLRKAPTTQEGISLLRETFQGDEDIEKILSLVETSQRGLIRFPK
jgi:UDP-N-acetylglucosamine acyltransferase